MTLLQLGHRHPPMRKSPIPGGLARPLPRLEHPPSHRADPTTELRETVEAIWQAVQARASEGALDGSRRGVRALLARRALVRRGTDILSAVIRRGVEAGAFWPHCASWAIRQLPFALVAGACAHWVFGLEHGPSLRACTAVEAALEVLRPAATQSHYGIRERGEP